MKRIAKKVATKYSAPNSYSLTLEQRGNYDSTFDTCVSNSYPSQSGDESLVYHSMTHEETNTHGKKPTYSSENGRTYEAKMYRKAPNNMEKTATQKISVYNSPKASATASDLYNMSEEFKTSLTLNNPKSFVIKKATMVLKRPKRK